jgi:hypothetical protein
MMLQQKLLFWILTVLAGMGHGKIYRNLFDWTKKIMKIRFRFVACQIPNVDKVQNWDGVIWQTCLTDDVILTDSPVSCFYFDSYRSSATTL